MTTVILPCNCISNYQDDRYGLLQRVHNGPVGKSGDLGRCTVCGSEHPLSLARKKDTTPAAKRKRKGR